MDEYTFPMILLGFGCVVGLITIVFALRRAFSGQAGEIGGWQFRGAFGRITAVARTTLAEGLRVKIASGFAIIVLLSIPVFWFTAEGDGTIKGRIQMFIAYSLGFSSVVMSVLTVFFSCRSLSVEIASRQVYGIVTKPIPRWQVLAGKWCGVMFLNLGLLTIVGLATYIGTKATVYRFKSDLSHDLQVYGGLTADQAPGAVAALDRTVGIGGKGLESPILSVLARSLGWSREQVADMLLRLPESSRVDLRRFDEVRRQVLVSRASVSPTLPDFSERVEEWFNELKEAGNLPEGWNDRRTREEMRAHFAGQFSSVPPGGIGTWRLKGPKPEKGREFIMSVRFKLHVPGQLLATQFLGQTFEENTLYCAWGIGDPTQSNFYEHQAPYPVGTFNEFEIPSASVAEDGTVIVNFRNLDPRTVDVVFDFPNALQVLYRVGSFDLNLFQTCLAILIPITCLASFGVCASTFLSFPIASLIVITMYIISSSMGFVAESFAVTEEYVDPRAPLPLWFEVRKISVEAVGVALSIGDVDPVRDIIDGRSVGWAALADKTWKHGFLENGAVMFVAVLVFRRRELAAVIV